jgi:hypothetical protein
MRFLIGLLTGMAIYNLAVTQSAKPKAKASTGPSAYLSDFQAIEFCAYTIKQGSTYTLPCILTVISPELSS